MIELSLWIAYGAGVFIFGWLVGRETWRVEANGGKAFLAAFAIGWLWPLAAFGFGMVWLTNKVPWNSLARLLFEGRRRS